MLIVIILFACFVLFLSTKLIDKYDPNRIFIYAWALYILSGILFLHKIYVFNGYFFLYVFVICIVLIFSSQIAKKIAIIKGKRKRNYILDDKRSILLLYTILLIAMIYPIMSLYLHGFSIVSFTSLDSLLTLNNEMAVIRYSESGIIKSSLSQVFLIFVYCAPLYGGFLYAQINKKYKKYCLATLLPSLLVLMTQNTKLTFIFSVLSWFSAYFVFCVFRSQPIFGKINLKKIIQLSIIIFSFISLLYTAMIFKTGKIDNEMISVIKIKFINYSYGSLLSADTWFEKYNQENRHNYEYGTKFLFGITNLLEIRDRNKGVYKSDSDYFIFSYKGEQMNNNIYTYIRYAIEDFGLLGSIFFFFLLGTIASYSYYKIQAKRYVFSSITLFVLSLCVYVYIYQPVATMYTSTLSSFIFLYFLLKMSYHTTKIR